MNECFARPFMPDITWHILMTVQFKFAEYNSSMTHQDSNPTSLASKISPGIKYMTISMMLKATAACNRSQHWNCLMMKSLNSLNRKCRHHDDKVVSVQKTRLVQSGNIRFAGSVFTMHHKVQKYFTWHFTTKQSGNKTTAVGKQYSATHDMNVSLIGTLYIQLQKWKYDVTHSSPQKLHFEHVWRASGHGFLNVHPLAELKQWQFYLHLLN